MKTIFTTLVSLFVITACQSQENAEENNPETYKVLVGAYTQHSPEGIYYYELDEEATQARFISSLELKNASFLVENKGVIYAVNEEGKGMLQAYRFDLESGEFSFINEQETGGASPCYVSLSNDMLYVANYGGSLSALVVESDNSIGERTELIANEGTGPKTDRQAGPHIHTAHVSPDGKTLWVADLGTDEVLVYDIEGKNLKEKTQINTLPGAGPRHIAFHPDLAVAYVICELESEIMLISTLDFSTIDTISTLAEDNNTINYPADIHISPDGRFLYGSNRGVNDLVFYSIDAETGMLTMEGNTSVRGDFPRNFSISKDGRYVAVANQKSDNVVFFKRDLETGMLESTGVELEISMPVFVKFL